MRNRIPPMSIAVGILLLMFCPFAFSQTKTVWDGVYSAEQATRGSSAFGANCTRCHGAGTDGDAALRPLAGNAFWKSYQESTVDYLHDFMSKNMPNGAGGSLSAATYVDLVAYLLQINGFPAGPNELTAQAMPSIRIIRQTGPAALPAGAMVHVVGCLAREGQNWIVNSATSPERTRKTGPGPDDASRPLGTGSYKLMYVVTSLTRFVGNRISVSGTLIGEGGADGLNTLAVSSVAGTCN